jgi:hypothetical protein
MPVFDSFFFLRCWVLGPKEGEDGLGQLFDLLFLSILKRSSASCVVVCVVGLSSLNAFHRVSCVCVFVFDVPDSSSAAICMMMSLEAPFSLLKAEVAIHFLALKGVRRYFSSKGHCFDLAKPQQSVFRSEFEPSTIA